MVVDFGGHGIGHLLLSADAEPDVLTANIPVDGIEALFVELRARGPGRNLPCFASAVEVASSERRG